MRGILAAAILGLASPVLSHEGHSHAGPAAEFLTLGVGARAAAMGEAYSAVADEASALHWNPAALTRIEKRSATFTHAAGYLGEGSLQYGAFGSRAGRAAAVGLGFEYLNPGRIEGTDDTSLDSGQTFSPHDLALSLGGAYQVQGGSFAGLALGAAVKYVRSQVVDSASTMAGDVGVLSPALFGERLRLALVGANLGPGLRYGADTEPLPQQLRLGAAFRALPRWSVSAEGVKPLSESAYAAVGTEYAITRDETWAFAGRLGYNTRPTSPGMMGQGVSTGLGLGYRWLTVDYAFMPMSELGNDQRVSLTMRF